MKNVAEVGKEVSQSRVGGGGTRSFVLEWQSVAIGGVRNSSLMLGVYKRAGVKRIALSVSGRRSSNLHKILTLGWIKEQTVRRRC